MGLRENILGSSKRNLIPFQAFGQTLFTERLSLYDQARWRGYVMGFDKLDPEEQVRRMAQVLVTFALDAEGNQVFKDEDVEALIKHPDPDAVSSAIEALVDANKVTQAQVDEKKAY